MGRRVAAPSRLRLVHLVVARLRRVAACQPWPVTVAGSDAMV
ncbi:MAG: hypothetical protein SNJ69_03705 [Chloroflexaceae bacterium]